MRAEQPDIVASSNQRVLEGAANDSAASCLPVVSVIIVNYNTRQMTLECLQKLYRELGDIPSEVWVVDNASNDGSCNAIRSEFPQVRLIENTGNRGFGAANNQAMAAAAGEYFLLLNSDAFPKPGAVQVLIGYLRTRPQQAAVGPRLLNEDGSLQLSCFRLPSPALAWYENIWLSSALPRHRVFGNYRRWTHEEERTVDYIIGACMLIRRQAYEQVGGFDERFFMYSEEADWQKRMRDVGWTIGFTPEANVVHLGGASGATEKPHINGHFYDSHDFYMKKHYGLSGFFSYRLAMILGCFLRMILWSVVVISVPRRRGLAKSKARLYSWLVLRETLHWRSGIGS